MSVPSPPLIGNAALAGLYSPQLTENGRYLVPCFVALGKSIAVVVPPFVGEVERPRTTGLADALHWCACALGARLTITTTRFYCRRSCLE